MNEKQILKEVIKTLLDIVTFLYKQYRIFLNPEDKVLIESKILLLSRLYEELKIKIEEVKENKNE
jgi:hypothetical protein